MSLFNFSKKAKVINPDDLLELGIKEYNNDEYNRAVEYFDQAVEIQNSSYNTTHSDNDRGALCNVLLLRGRSHFMMKDFQKAYFDFLKIYELLGNIVVQQSTIKDCKLLRQACEYGSASAEQMGDTKAQKELLRKHLDVSKSIFKTTEMAEDYSELGDSYDYMITISDSCDEKLFNAKKMKEVFQNLLKQFPNHPHFSERLDYTVEALENQLKIKISEALKKQDYSTAASGFEELANTRMEHTLGRKEVRYDVLDKDIEFLHEAAKNYQKAGNLASAIKCIEKAIQLRSAIVESTGSDLARARLSYSYIMAITTDPEIENKDEYAHSAYAILDELEKKRPEDSGLKQLKEIASKFLN